MNQENLTEIYSKALYFIPSFKINLKVGSNHPDLDELLTQNKAKSAALITAFNPYSQILPKEENDQRNEELKSKIIEKWNCIDYISNEDSTNNWKELGFLVINIKIDEVLSLAGSYGQHAILYYEKNKVVELIFTGAQIKSNDDWRQKILGL